MPNTDRFRLPAEYVRLRSYLIWEREGRHGGHDAQYWMRAEAELDAECWAALQGRTMRYVLPRILISVPPKKITSTEARSARFPASTETGG